MQAIAHRAGVSVGLLYRYAPSKEALFAAALERVAQVARLADQLASGADVDAQSRVGEGWLADELTDGQWPAMVRQAWLAADTSTRRLGARSNAKHGTSTSWRRPGRITHSRVTRLEATMRNPSRGWRACCSMEPSGMSPSGGHGARSR